MKNNKILAFLLLITFLLCGVSQALASVAEKTIEDRIGPDYTKIYEKTVDGLMGEETRYVYINGKTVQEGEKDGVPYIIVEYVHAVVHDFGRVRPPEIGGINRQKISFNKNTQELGEVVNPENISQYGWLPSKWQEDDLLFWHLAVIQKYLTEEYCGGGLFGTITDIIFILVMLYGGYKWLKKKGKLNKFLNKGKGVQTSVLSPNTPNSGVALETESAQFVFCSNCGKKNVAGALFCENCGAKLEIPENSVDVANQQNIPAMPCENTENSNSTANEKIAHAKMVSSVVQKPNGSKEVAQRGSKKKILIAMFAILFVVGGLVAVKYVMLDKPSAKIEQTTPTETVVPQQTENSESSDADNTGDNLEKLDSEIKGVYENILGKAGDEQKSLLTKSQDAWIAYDQADNNFAYDTIYNQEIHGTIGGELLGDILRGRREARIKELKNCLDNAENAAPTDKTANSETKVKELNEELKHLYQQLLQLATEQKMSALEESQSAWCAFDKAAFDYDKKFNAASQFINSCDRLQIRINELKSYLQEAKDYWESENVAEDTQKDSSSEVWIKAGNNTTFKKINNDKAIVKMVKSNGIETYEMTFYDTYFIVDSVSADNVSRNQALQKEIGIMQTYEKNPRVKAVKDKMQNP